MKKSIIIGISIGVVLLLLIGVGVYTKSKQDSNCDNRCSAPPSKYNPLIISKIISINDGKITNSLIKYYNKYNFTQNVAFKINNCTYENKTELKVLPTLISHNTNVNPNDPEGFSAKISLKNVSKEYTPGIYLCTLVAYNYDNPEEIYESEMFFLEVTS